MYKYPIYNPIVSPSKPLLYIGVSSWDSDCLFRKGRKSEASWVMKKRVQYVEWFYVQKLFNVILTVLSFLVSKCCQIVWIPFKVKHWISLIIIRKSVTLVATRVTLVAREGIWLTRRSSPLFAPCAADEIVQLKHDIMGHPYKWRVYSENHL